MATNRLPKPRAPRLLPSPEVLGREPSGFSPMSLADQEELASLVYLSGAAPGINDTSTPVSNFIQSLNNQVYTTYMNDATTASVG